MPEPAIAADPFAGLHPIFRECVFSGERFPGLSQPFQQDGWVYATNGRIAVRMPASEAPGVPAPSSRVPHRMKSAFQGAKYHPEPIELPEAPETETCPECNGRGTDVPNGDTKCGFCEGEKTLLIDSPITLDTPSGPALMASRYVGQLRRHGALVYAPVKLWRTFNQCNPFKFTIGSLIEGRAAPMARA